MSKIIVHDDGTGMEYEKAPEMFKSLGGSWKRAGATTKKERRFLHGQDGRGRFKAFALGRVADWDVTYWKGDKLSTFKVTMIASNMKEVVISDEEEAGAERRQGVTLTISELHNDFPSLTSDVGLQELAEIFALYLSDYKDVSINVDGSRVDPSTLIASQASSRAQWRGVPGASAGRVLLVRLRFAMARLPEPLRVSALRVTPPHAKTKSGGVLTHTSFVWKGRKSDLRKIVEFQNNGEITRIYTYKVLHSDFYAMREKLKELGRQPARAGVTKIDFPVPTVAEFAKKIEAVKAGTEGTAGEIAGFSDRRLYLLVTSHFLFWRFKKVSFDWSARRAGR
jgi:hypothetical protein